MQSRRTPWAAGLIGLATLLAARPAPAQPSAPAVPEGVEVLARGPVHEAYALPADQQSGPGPVAPKRPPEPVEELPPDQKPEGDNVQWIPGYWQWDEERAEFIWVSGFWRTPPPGRVWVPGGWRQTGDRWQWAGGFWGPLAGAGRPATQLDYLPEPPPAIEAGPAVPAPADDSVYVPGSWVYRERYVWRPGYWMDCRPGWVWTPACYRWTPAGCVFVDGYWDYPLADRGVLFAPAYIPPAVCAAPGFVYTPAYAVREQCLFGALFARRGWGSYYFGDYFGRRYWDAGYTPWCGTQIGINLGFGRHHGYHDPLYGYYRAAHRGDPYWGNGIGDLYAGRYRGAIAPPPHTLAQQNVVVNNLANNTVVNNTAINNAAMLAPLANVRSANRALAAVAPVERRQLANNARQFADVAQQRRQFEAQPAARGPRPPAPRSLQVNLPEQVVARPPAPPRANVPTSRPRPEVPTGPPRAAAPTPRPPAPPQLTPAAGTTPRPNPRPPAPPTTNPTPRPQGVSPTPPQARPQPKVVPPQPRVNPAPTRPPAPQPPTTQPRVSPPKGPTVQPRVNPVPPPAANPVRPRPSPPAPVARPQAPTPAPRTLPAPPAPRSNPTPPAPRAPVVPRSNPAPAAPRTPPPQPRPSPPPARPAPRTPASPPRSAPPAPRPAPKPPAPSQPRPPAPKPKDKR